MPVLKNPRHERFAQERAMGKDNLTAYCIAYDVPCIPGEEASLRSKGNGVAHQAPVVSRVAEILQTRAAIGMISVERAVAASTIDTERVLNELAVIAFSDIGDIFDFTTEGPDLKLKSPKDIPERVRRAIASIKVKRFVEGKRDEARTVETVEFKFWSKDVALDKLGRYLHMWTNEGGGDVRKPTGWAETDLAKHLAAKEGGGHLDS